MRMVDPKRSLIIPEHRSKAKLTCLQYRFQTFMSDPPQLSRAERGQASRQGPLQLTVGACMQWAQHTAERSGLLQEWGCEWGRRGHMGASHARAGPAAVPGQALHCCVRPRSRVKVSRGVRRSFVTVQA